MQNTNDNAPILIILSCLFRWAYRLSSLAILQQCTKQYSLYRCKYYVMLIYVLAKSQDGNLKINNYPPLILVAQA